jgi:hypothetical protein
VGADSTLGGGVAFLEPYVSYGEGGEIASSLGLGYRHLFNSQPVSVLSRADAPQAGFFEEGVFVGVNVFVDMLDTEANNQFWQLGVGLEAGSRYLEFRGNYYIPLSERQLAEQTRTREISRSSRERSTSWMTNAGDPYATGYSIAQDATFATRTTTTTTTTTIERLFRRYEEGMEGWDAEAALLVPGLDQYFDLRLIGGYYSFDNQPFGPQTGGTGNVEGWKAGVEIRPVPAVILTGTWYEDDRLTGSDWTVGLQLQIPFEAGDLGDGQGFWGRVGDAFKPRRRHLAERLAEPVHRQNAAVKLASSVEVDTSVSSQTKSSTKTTSGTRMIVLANDIVFVNNGDAVGNGIQAGDAAGNGANGTAERPYDTLEEGSFTAGTYSNGSGRTWSVYTQGGTGIDYTDEVSLVGSTQFISSFHQITGLYGKTFGGNTARPKVLGGIFGEEVSFMGVSGYEIQGGFEGVALIAFDVDRFVAHDNLLHDLAAGIYIESTFADTTADIRENMFGDSETGVWLEAREGSGITAEVVENEFDGDFDDGIYGYVYDAALLEVLVQDNLFRGSYQSALGNFDAVGQEMSPGPRMDLTITGNIAEAGTTLVDDGFQLRSFENAVAFAWVEDNDFLGSSSDSFVEVTTEGASEFEVTVTDNYFGGTALGQAVDLESKDTSTLLAEVSDNTFGGILDTALDADKGDSSFFELAITNNTLSGTFAADAMTLSSDGDTADGSRFDVEVDSNLFSGTFALDGIDGKQLGAGLIDLTLTNNTFSGSFVESGIDLTAADTTGASVLMTALIDNNTFGGSFSSGNSAGALHVQANSASRIGATITDNTFSGSFTTDGISLRTASTAQLTATVAYNTVPAGVTIGDAFLDAQSSSTSLMTLIGVDGNSVLGTVVRGFYFREQNTSTMTVNGTLDADATNIVDPGTPTTKTGTPSGTIFMNGSALNLNP